MRYIALILMAHLPIACSSPPSTVDTATSEPPPALTEPDVSSNLAEILLISGKFQHGDPGPDGFLYDVTIVILVPEDAKTMLEERITGMQGRLRERYVRFFRESDTAGLNDPDKTAIKNATRETCDLYLGTTESGDSYIADVVISHWSRFRSEI